VWKLCEARLGRPLQKQYIHNALMSINALYYDRGTYGAWKHFPLEKSQQDLIVEAVDEIVRASEVYRQWHAEELLRRITDNYEWLVVGLNKHLLDLLLRRATTLKSVGRMVWIPIDTRSTISEGRIDISDACVRILMDAGKPLLATAIRLELQAYRGIGNYFQMHPTREITRTAPGLWGLVRRDFNIDDKQYEQLIGEAVEAVSSRGEMVGIEEIDKILRIKCVTPSTLSQYALVSLLQTSRNLHVFRGHMIGLADWASSDEQENDALSEYELECAQL